MPIRLKESIARRREVIRDDQIVEGRSELLGRRDRDLLRAVWLDGMPASRVAELVGVTPRQVCYRVGRLMEHIQSDRFLAAARVLPRLRGKHAMVARLAFCQGISERAVARMMATSYHRVRRLAAEVRVMMHAQELSQREWRGLKQRHRRGK